MRCLLPPSSSAARPSTEFQRSALRSVDRAHPGLGLARRFIGRAVLFCRSLLQRPQLRLDIVEIGPVDERVDRTAAGTGAGAFHEGEQFRMAGFRGVLARGDIGAAQETEFARCDIGIADGLCTSPGCCGEQRRWAKPRMEMLDKADAKGVERHPWLCHCGALAGNGTI
jgi:hypothetical protein